MDRPQGDAGKLWYDDSLDVFLNRWFASYEAAHESREMDGGYLLPYRRHFFICEAGLIQRLGLDPADPDWERIGWDAARPLDREAYERLRARRERAARGGASD